MPQKYNPELKARALQPIEERVSADQCSGGVTRTASVKPSAGAPPSDSELV